MAGTPRRGTIPEPALRSLGARTWAAVAVSISVVLALGCSDNVGPAGPGFPASQTTGALALVPKDPTATIPNDGGQCFTRIQFLATGGVPPYKFVILVFSGKSSIDANGLYTAQLAAATRLDDTVVVTDSVGTRASSTVTITCS